MKHILLFGAGKSATVLIDYLLSDTEAGQWQVVIADADLATIQAKIKGAPLAKAVALDITNAMERRSLIEAADIVISLLPPALHFEIAKDCLEFCKNLLTASYVDDKIRTLQPEIEKKQLLFLCEMGLDPGIDHMSAMKIIDQIHSDGGTIHSFRSHCGGLVAPESDDNPWHYKISWNPRNIVLAGSAGATYKMDGKKFQISYDKIFKNCPELSIDDLPVFAWYANRDSSSYVSTYGLEETSTFLRTTLRYASFCRGWNAVCHLGLTDTSDGAPIKEFRTVSEWFHQKLNGIELKPMSWLEYLQGYVNEQWHTELTEQMDFLDFFEEKLIPDSAACSADILQSLLEERLILGPADRDMIVMLHEIDYLLNDKYYAVRSSLTVKGEDNLRTAMAKTVGLPIGIAAKLILNQTISLQGLHIPILPEIYEPVLQELKNYGIVFREKLTSSPA